MSDEVVSKSEFARAVGVAPGRVTQWIAAGQIDGDALVGSGRAAKIRVTAAIKQLNDRLDIERRVRAGAKARLDGVVTAVPLRPVISEAALKQLVQKLSKCILQVLLHEFTIDEDPVSIAECDSHGRDDIR